MKLPKGNFKWVNLKKITNIYDFIMNIDVEGNYGYLFCVDLSYPDKLHDQHNAFPLAPHTVEIQYKHLSPYNKKILFANGGNKNFKCDKLIGSFLPRKKYVVHIKNLQFYLKCGLKLEKVHKAIKFTQEAFLKPYIEMCTLKRKNANNKFEKNLYKLMCNSVYGKTLQDVRNYQKVMLHTKEDSCLKAIKQPTFKRSVILKRNMVLTVHKQQKILLDKPFLIGQTILDLSKLHMMQFWYDVLLKNVDYKKIELLFTDTGTIFYKHFLMLVIVRYAINILSYQFYFKNLQTHFVLLSMTQISLCFC